MMQMLESFLGPQGARYAQFVLAAIVLIVLIFLVWWLIRKAMGDRLNMSDKPDRRGRPPRLGITESFAVDRQGRRLVMVRRDNVEHLVMIGGPNDVLIESNVVRGERPMVARPELRLSEADLVAQPVLAETPGPILAPAKPAPPTRPPEPVAPLPPPAVAAPPKPMPAPPPSAPLPPVAPPPMVTPVVELPKPVLAVAAPPMVVAPAEDVPVAAKAAGMTLSERIRSGIPIGSPSAKPPEAPRPPEPVKAPEPVRPPDVPKLAEGYTPEPAKPEPAKQPEPAKPADAPATPPAPAPEPAKPADAPKPAEPAPPAPEPAK